MTAKSVVSNVYIKKVIEKVARNGRFLKILQYFGTNGGDFFFSYKEANQYHAVVKSFEKSLGANEYSDAN